ncbi:MAG: glycosyltransferase family 2 protein [Muribaculum sp.]|nr:glycosyltransferase family 2 protein [Muribaculum sp.]
MTATSIKPQLAIVVPCYNEEEALKTTLPTLLSCLSALGEKGLISPESYILCVDDGSQDHTWSIITQYYNTHTNIKAISLAHNRGQQNALLAGIMTVDGHCDAVVTIDADLQDDPAAIEDMIRLYSEQAKDIVYGIRSQRDADGWLKRTTAHRFYRLQRSLGLETYYDHADYRLMSARAISLLAEYGETNLFLRGIIPQIGLDCATVTYPRQQRIGGKPKYNLGRMINFSLDGITSFTSRPIRLIFLLGLCMLLADIAVAAYVFTAYFTRETISGWTSLMLSVWFLGSLILMSIGVVGEYVGKIYTEVKRRPRYAIKDKLW